MFQASEAASSQGEYMPGVRFAGVVKAKGTSYEGVGRLITFVIEKVSLLARRTERAQKRTDWSPGDGSRSDRDQTK